MQIAVLIGLILEGYSALRLSDSRAEDNNRLSLLIYNVLSHNQEVEALRNLIRPTPGSVDLIGEIFRDPTTLLPLVCNKQSH